MNAGPNENPYPSLEEFRGYYNIRDDQYEDCPTAVRRSVEEVPEFGFPEMWEVYKAAEKWFAREMPVPRNESFDPLSEFDFTPRDETDDRTQDIDEVDFERLNVQFLRRIQREFLGRFPLWRVVLDGEDLSTGIVIYPNVIRFGNHPADVDLEKALRELVPRAVELRKARQCKHRPKIEFLQRHLSDAVREIGDRPYQVIGVLDNFNGDYGRLTVCLLIRGAETWAIHLNGPAAAGKKFTGSGDSFGVNAQGQIISYINVPKTSPFCVALSSIPADYRGPLTILERESGKSHMYELKSENITRTAPQK